jgi:NAD-dependent deacetylase
MQCAMNEPLLQIPANSSIFVLTGAGISKESGIQTFRDNDGLWNDHRIEDVASPEGFYRNPTLVYNFYNNRRNELNSGTTEPNKGHYDLYSLGKYIKINVITQNIDNLHEKSGISPIHMHGQLNQARCIMNEDHIFEWFDDLNETHKCTKCDSQLRPNICWFGEMPFHMDQIHDLAEQSALFISIGTSGEVYPAASFVSMFKDMRKPTVELNLEPSRNKDLFDISIHKPATVAVEEFKNLLLKNLIK